MKIPFKPIEIEDRDIITSFTIPSNYKNCDYSFANIAVGDSSTIASSPLLRAAADPLLDRK